VDAFDKSAPERVEPGKTESSRPQTPRRGEDELFRAAPGQGTPPLRGGEDVTGDLRARREIESRPAPGSVTETKSPVTAQGLAQERPQEHSEAFHSFVAQSRVAPLLDDWNHNGSGQGPEQGDGKGATPKPTIQVTIGRIEVRATQSAPPPGPRSRPAQPATSLDEYLRRRGGGAR
jgi:hypothetical protein